MKKILALLLAALMVFSLVACGGGKTGGKDDTVYVLKMSSTRPDMSWYAKMYDDMAAELEQASNGRLKIEIHHNNTLGAPADIWNMFITGGIDILDMSPGMVGSFPVSEIFNVPFTLDNNQDVLDMMNELLDAGLLKEYSDNMKVLMFLPNGSLELMTTNKKVETMADFKGLKLRGSSKTIGMAIDAMGGVATSVQPSEQSMALSQGVLDGVITGAPFAELQSIYETCHYMMRYNLAMSCMFCGINPKSYEKLPADLQELLTSTCQRYLKEVWMTTQDSDFAASYERLGGEHGMDLYVPSDALIADMKAATAPLLDTYKQSLVDAGIDADAVMNIVNKYIH